MVVSIGSLELSPAILANQGYNAGDIEQTHPDVGYRLE